MLGMDMSEQMGFEIMERGKPFKNFLGAIVDAIIEIKDSIGGRMGDQDVGVGWDSDIVAALAVGYAIAHEHRDSVELQAFNLNPGIAQIMNVVAKSVDVGSIQTVVVVAADEYLWRNGSSHSQFMKSIASASLPFMVKSPEWTTTSASGKSRSLRWQP